MIVLAIVAIAATLGLGAFVVAMLRPTENSATVAATTDPTPTPSFSPTAITAAGRIEPAGGVLKVAAPAALGANARVSRLLVREGMSVKAGQVLAVMDSSERLLASAVQAQAQVKQAQNYLVQVRTEADRGNAEIQAVDVEQLQANLQDLTRSYQKYEDLHRNGAISAVELSSRREAVDRATQSLRQAQRELERMEAMQPINLRQAETQVAVAVANFNRAKADFEYSLVRAPIGGQILKIHAAPGETVGKEGVLELGNLAQMYAIAEVNETYANRVRLGQQATVSSRALPIPLTGVVDHIGLQVRQDGNAGLLNANNRVVEVKIRLNDSRSVARMTNAKVEVAFN